MTLSSTASKIAQQLFDAVTALSVEGLKKSALARVQKIAWNAVDRCLEKAGTSCCRFNQHWITKTQIRELQAEEILALIGGDGQPRV